MCPAENGEQNVLVTTSNTQSVANDYLTDDLRSPVAQTATANTVDAHHYLHSSSDHHHHHHRHHHQQQSQAHPSSGALPFNMSTQSPVKSAHAPANHHHSDSNQSNAQPPSDDNNLDSFRAPSSNSRHFARDSPFQAKRKQSIIGECSN
jgi:hypothetical protein